VTAMRIVGTRVESVLDGKASAQALERGLDVVDAAATFGWVTSTGQRKGVYRFTSFEAMEQHRIESLVRAMTERARKTTA
jgi:hypothetical protein